MSHPHDQIFYIEFCVNKEINFIFPLHEIEEIKSQLCHDNVHGIHVSKISIHSVTRFPNDVIVVTNFNCNEYGQY